MYFFLENAHLVEFSPRSLGRLLDEFVENLIPTCALFSILWRQNHIRGAWEHIPYLVYCSISLSEIIIFTPLVP